jgi:hypothetical protein
MPFLVVAVWSPQSLGLDTSTANCSGYSHWQLSDELIAGIFLLLSHFDKQFEYSLSF